MEKRRKYANGDTCTHGSCLNPKYARDWCKKHYSQWYKTGVVGGTRKVASYGGILCSYHDCENRAKVKGLCSGHYSQHWRGDELRPIRQPIYECTFEECAKSHYARGLCAGHYQQTTRGEDLKPLQTPKLQFTDKNGYVFVKNPEHPNAYSTGYVQEHHLVMSELLGREVRTRIGENVHHINGVRGDNRIENLELWNTSQPSGQRVEDKLKFYMDFIVQYQDEYPELMSTFLEKVQKRS